MIIDTDKIKDKVASAVKAGLLFLVVIYSASTLFRTTDPALKVPNASPRGETYCTRESPYPLSPEFDRVLSLLLQRYQQVNSPQYPQLSGMRNCVDIQYGDLGDDDVEGAFYFDESLSNPQRLYIEVDSKYSVVDDITTAFLLSHEMAHARQYVEVNTGKQSWSCIDSEVDAFYSQLLFGSMINEEEKNSVLARIEGGSRNTQLKQYEDLINLSYDVIVACGMDGGGTPTSSDIACYKSGLYQAIKSQIQSNPYYQKQCEGGF